MDIVGHVRELTALKAEAKRLRDETKKNNERIKKTELVIVDFMSKKEQSGLKFKNITIIAEEKVMRKQKSKQQKVVDLRDTLSKYDVDTSAEMISELLETVKGQPVSNETKIRIKKN